jgi:hypothetical protein
MKLPREATVLTRQERIKYWFLTNRTFLGWVVGLAGVLCRFLLSFKGHDEIADKLKELADLILLGGASLVSAGQTKSDAAHEEKLHAVIRERSGQFPLVDFQQKQQKP